MNEWLYLSCQEKAALLGAFPLYLKQVIKVPTQSTTVSPTAVYLTFKKLIFVSTSPYCSSGDREGTGLWRMP